MLQGSKIVLEGANGKQETVSDSYGDFEFEGLAKNTKYALTVSYDGYVSQTCEVITQKDINLGEIFW